MQLPLEAVAARRGFGRVARDPRRPGFELLAGGARRLRGGFRLFARPAGGVPRLALAQGERFESVQVVTGRLGGRLGAQGVPLGLGHAVLCARPAVGNEPFFVHLADDLIYSEVPCLKQMHAQFEQHGSSVLGVETEIINQEWKVFLDKRTQKAATQAFRAGWIGDYNDAYTFAELVLSDSGLNDFGYASEKYDGLVEKAAGELDLDKRAEYLQEAERVLLDDLPLIPIYFYVTVRMVKPWVVGYEPNIMDHYRTQDVKILKH